MGDNPTFTPDRVPHRNTDVRMRRFRGKLYVACGEEALELDDVASFIFSRVDGVATLQQIGEMVAREYEIPVAEAVADSAELLDQLAASDIVRADRA
jgi:pyrroloquinoline quinone biosynthesis protein D